MNDDLAVLAARALELVQPRTLVGLGSGRASIAFVRALGQRARGGLDITCVATSEAIACLATEVGLTVVELGAEPLDITVDGADEVDPELNALKGYGGALVRERIVAVASRRQVLLVGADKLVPKLGTRGRIPVEVLPFAARFSAARLGALGLRPEVRGGDKTPTPSDNGNVILDCGTAPLDDPAATERAIRTIPGVIDSGLFLGTAALILVADNGRVTERVPKRGEGRRA